MATGCVRPGAAPPLSPTAPIVVAVVTWNMHAGKGDLPRLVDDLASGRLAGAPLTPYVLLLQEAIDGGEHDVRAIAAAHHASAFFAPVRTTSRGVSGNAIVSTLPLLEAHALALPRVRQPRGAIAARIAVDGEPVFVADAHLENRVSWWRGGLLSDRARGRQAEALLAAVPVRGAVIVGGDFNTWLGTSEPAWRKMAARFPQTREPMRPTFHDRLVLDHVFADLPPGWSVTEFVAPDSYGSDHHPVVAAIVRAARAAAPARGSRERGPARRAP